MTCQRNVTVASDGTSAYMKSEEWAAICESEMPCASRSSMMRVKKSGRSESFFKRLGIVSMLARGRFGSCGLRPSHKIHCVCFMLTSILENFVNDAGKESLHESCDSGIATQRVSQSPLFHRPNG